MILRQFGYGEIKLPPVGERQIRRITERDAFAKASLEPTEEAVEASVDGDAERDESLSRISRALMKIDVVTQGGLRANNGFPEACTTRYSFKSFLAKAR